MIKIVVSDVALFRAHVLVDSDRLDASLSRAGFFLCVDLWFCEHEHQLPSISKVRLFAICFSCVNELPSIS